MAKPLSDKSNINEDNKIDAKDKKDSKDKKDLKESKETKVKATSSKIEKITSDKTPETSTQPEIKPQKTKNKLINKLSLTGISNSNNNDSTGNDKSSNKENGKGNKKAVSAQNSQELSSAESPPPVQLQKKKKLSFRQRLSRCGSGCKNKVTKKNSNEMELENLSNSNNDLTNGQGNRSTNQQEQTTSPKSNDDKENELDTKSPNASNDKTGNTNNVDANHCARNFFCWCCSCCSCLNSNLTFDQNCKENSSLSINKQEHSSADHPDFTNEPPPTLDEIRAWSESFDKLITNSWGRSVFRDFLKREYSEENILFYMACESLKNEDNMSRIEEKARLIYEDFISILSPKEVSLDSKVREIINKNMLKPTKETFEEAQLQIYQLMHRDSYPRFINSAMYRKLAQLPSPSRKNSLAVANA